MLTGERGGRNLSYNIVVTQSAKPDVLLFTWFRGPGVRCLKEQSRRTIFKWIDKRQVDVKPYGWMKARWTDESWVKAMESWTGEIK
jgi:hypothetical protein